MRLCRNDTVVFPEKYPRNNHVSFPASSSASSLTTVAAIAGVLALLVLVLFVALVIVYKKRQTAPPPSVQYSKAHSEDSSCLV